MKNLVFLFSFCVIIFSAISDPANAQATLDRVLATVSVSGSEACSTVDVRLNRPAGYRHHSPQQSGRNLDVFVDLLGTEAGEQQETPAKEAASVPPGNTAGLDAVVFDAEDSVLRILFRRAVEFRVIMDNNTRHLRIDVAEPGKAMSCLGQSGANDNGSSQSSEAAKGASEVSPADAASALKLGKTQLAAKNYARATAYFTKAVETGKGETKQKAQELLGLSRERAGQLAHAKTEYQRYLKSYPSGEGHLRVRARLDAVLAALDETAQAELDSLRAKRAEENQAETKADQAVTGADSASGKGDADVPLVDTGTKSLNVTGRGITLHKNEAKADPNAWTWERNGSIAQYYYRNDSLRSTDPTKQNYGLHEVFQNEVLSSADGFLRGENQHYELELRASLYNERGFGQQSDINATNVGSLYIDALMKDNGLSAKFGRQSKSTGGAFGRFDGALLGWDLGNDVKLQAYAGSPVYRRDAAPFADDRYFYGASIDYTFPDDNWAGALYAIGQNVGDVIDRRAIGAELRYTNQTISAYAAGDYDIFYNELNNAYLNANWRAREGTSIYGTVDFRRVPFLVTSNALMGQVEDDLQSLVDIFGEDSVYELAVDRTATAKTASLGISQQLSDDWQITLDAMIADYSGTPASGGVDAIPDPGMEYYGSILLSGANVFDDDDTLNLGLRYSASDSSDFYMADAYYRFMVNEDWRLSPRLRLSMRDSKTSDQKQYVISSSIASRYRLNKNWSFEAELGARWEDTITPTTDTQSIDILATAGYRFEF